jgi:hypothetical protein
MPDFTGVVQIQDGGGAPTIVLDGDNGILTVGGSSHDGQFIVTTGGGVTRLAIDGATGSVTITAADGDPVVTIDGAQGNILIHRKSAGTNHEILEFDASGAALSVGGQAHAGDVIVRDAANLERVKLDGGDGDIWV